MKRNLHDQVEPEKFSSDKPSGASRGSRCEYCQVRWIMNSTTVVSYTRVFAGIDSRRDTFSVVFFSFHKKIKILG
jgi:hypothetical protein